MSFGRDECGRGGERAGSVTGPAAGEGEGRPPASAPRPLSELRLQNGALLANRWDLASAR